MDRTSEFLQFTCVNVDHSKPHVLKKKGNSTSSSSSGSNDVPQTRTAFHDAAAEIARGVHRASASLSRLTKLVRRQGLFDDPTEEINNLIYRIKQDLDELNTKCDSAQKYVDDRKNNKGENNQSATHNVKVVGQLKTDLMHTTKSFKGILEVRSSKMKDQRVRKIELTGAGVLSPLTQFNASKGYNDNNNNNSNNNSNLYDNISSTNNSRHGNGNAKAIPTPYSIIDQSYAGGVSDTDKGNSGQYQSQLLAPPQASQYYEHREQAVTEVEKTIAELGTLFKRLATMISEQQELVERIDDDIESSVSTANNAHSVLLKAYESVSSNRALYTKLGAILALFLIFFSIFIM